MSGILHMKTLILYDGVMKYQTKKARDSNTLQLKFYMEYSGKYDREAIVSTIKEHRKRFAIYLDKNSMNYDVPGVFHITSSTQKNSNKLRLNILVDYPFRHYSRGEEIIGINGKFYVK